MKRCPTCNQTFDDDALSFCLNDGAGLVSETSSVPTANLQATMMATPPSLGGSSHPPPASPSGPGSGSFNPPPPNPSWAPPPPNQSWAAPSTPQTSSPPKSGGMNKKLIFGGIGCLGLGGIVVIIGIVILVVLSGPSSKMNPYKGDLKALVPENVGEYKRVDVDPLGDRDKESLGKITEGFGVAYESYSDVDIKMLIGNYASSKDAEEGLKSFTDKAVTNGWLRGVQAKKKIGWRTVGIRYQMYKDLPTSKNNESALPDGAVLTQAQDSTAKKTKPGQFVCWTNGSVIYLVLSDNGKAVDFEKVFDKEVK